MLVSAALLARTGLVAASPPRVALVPNAIAFSDPRHGIAGTGWTSCFDNPGFGCRPQGTISFTSNGGRTWKVAVRTPEPVTAVSTRFGVERAVLVDGENLASTDGGHTWRPAAPPPARAPPPPPSCGTAELADVVVTPKGSEWALCTDQPGAGNVDKAVYRLVGSRWKRVAWTPWGRPGRAVGGISVYGYPAGMAMADDGFGLIWESRGTLYVTRDGGSHWIGLPKVAEPEVDFGFSGAALPHGVGFVLLAKGGGEVRRLIETRDAGRTWHVVHGWR